MLDGDSREKIHLYLLRQFQVGPSIRLLGEALYKVMGADVLYTKKCVLTSVERTKFLHEKGAEIRNEFSGTTERRR